MDRRVHIKWAGGRVDVVVDPGRVITGSILTTEFLQKKIDISLYGNISRNHILYPN